MMNTKEESEKAERERAIRLFLNLMLRGGSHEHPHIAGIALFFTAKAATMLEESALCLEYMSSIGNVLASAPQEVRGVFEECLKESKEERNIRIRLHSGIFCSRMYALGLSAKSHAFLLRRVLEAHRGVLEAFPWERKHQWLPVAEALVEDVLLHGGGHIAQVKKLFQMRDVLHAHKDTGTSPEDALIDIITHAVLVIGQGAHANSVFVLAECGLHLLPFLKGVPLLKQSTYVPADERGVEPVTNCDRFPEAPRSALLAPSPHPGGCGHALLGSAEPTSHRGQHRDHAHFRAPAPDPRHQRRADAPGDAARPADRAALRTRQGPARTGSAGETRDRLCATRRIKRSRGGAARQGEAEGRAATGALGLDPDPAAVELDHPLDDGEADAGALTFRIQPVEEPEDLLLVPRLDPRAVVADVDDVRVPGGRRPDADLDAWPRLLAHELDGVVDQVL